MPDLRIIVELLRKHYGEPELPPAHGPFELVMWENACYLLPDERRAAVFDGLRKLGALRPHGLFKADRDALLRLAILGGMRPETRVLRWLEIAQITLDQFGGDLDAVLEKPYAVAKRALMRFPAIGAPGAEKILMYCGASTGLPLESNGLRVLTRVGYGSTQKNYAAAYRSVQEALGHEAGSKASAHLLLRKHGKTLCRIDAPACRICPVAEVCAKRLP